MTKDVLLLSVFAVLSTAIVNAQETFRLKVSVPFSFHIGQSVMPAGEYDVRTQDASHNVLTFYSPVGNAVATIVTTPARKTESQEKGRLVFNRYGAEYFLAEVWNSNSKAGALFNNKTRREMVIAAADPNRQTAVLYAKGR